MLEQVVGVLVGAGITVAGLVALVRWGGDRLAERFLLTAGHKYDKILARESSELESRASLVGAAAAASSASFLAAQERRLLAIDRMWKSVLETRGRFSRAMTLFDILTPTELETIGRDSPFVAGMPVGFDEFGLAHRVLPDCEEHRPYLGEYLWLRFFVHRAVHGRLALRVSEGLQKGRVFPWDRQPNGQDDGVISLLQHVLEPDQIAMARKHTTGGPGLALRLIEGQMLSEIERMLSGADAASRSLTAGSIAAGTIWSAERTLAGKERASA